MTDQRAIMRGWPASLVEIAEVIGVAATLRLVDAYGGSVCYVPTRLDDSHRLVQAIGPLAAQRLVARYTGEKLEIAGLYVARTRKALIANAEGSVAEVARKLGVTRRWVRMVRNAGRSGDPRQIEMFPRKPE